MMDVDKVSSHHHKGTLILYESRSTTEAPISLTQDVSLSLGPVLKKLSGRYSPVLRKF
jgi:hypothetical protein